MNELRVQGYGFSGSTKQNGEEHNLSQILSSSVTAEFIFYLSFGSYFEY